MRLTTPASRFVWYASCLNLLLALLLTTNGFANPQNSKTNSKLNSEGEPSAVALCLKSAPAQGEGFRAETPQQAPAWGLRQRAERVEIEKTEPSKPLPATVAPLGVEPELAPALFLQKAPSEESAKPATVFEPIETEEEALKVPDTNEAKENAAYPANVEKSLPYPVASVKQRPHLNHLYQFDDTPLKGRIPVLLLPGRAQEYQLASWWRKFNFQAEKRADFNKAFKLFVFLYDSRAEVDDETHELEQELLAFYKVLPNQQPTVLVTYSLGGVVARNTLLEYPELLKQTHAIWGLATPYQGGPIFTPNWFKSYSSHSSPIRRLWDKASYLSYFRGKKNLVHSMAWTNFDNSMPHSLRHNALRLPIPNNPALEQAFKDKLIIYTSFLDNHYTEENQTPRYFKNPAAAALQVPKTILGAVVPFYGFTVHSVLDYTNQQVANIRTYSPKNAKRGVNTHLYRYNDGTIPLSSMLYLAPRSYPYSEGWHQLASLSTAAQVRVFRNLDHVDLGHYRFFEKQITVKDALHPELPKTTPNGWLFHDLMNLLDEKATAEQGHPVLLPLKTAVSKPE